MTRNKSNKEEVDKGLIIVYIISMILAIIIIATFLIIKL